MATVRTVSRQKISGSAEGETWDYLVTFWELNATATEAREAVGIDEGEKYPGKQWYAKVSANQHDIDEANCWDVSVVWATRDKNDEKPPEGGGEEGTVWSTRVELGTERIERPASGGSLTSTSDDMYKVCNSAGTPYNPPPTYDDADGTLKITFNTNSGSRINAIRSKLWHVNSDSISFSHKGVTFSYAAGKLRLIDYTASVDKTYNEDDEEAWEVSMTFAERVTDEHHDIEVQDAGYVDIDGKLFTDLATGEPRSEPTLLDGSGHELEDGNTSQPRRFNVRDRVEFSSLFAGL